MQKKFDSYLELTDYFKEKSNCISYFTYQRWPEGVTCPHCNHTRVYILKTGYKCANNQCYKKFNCFTKTIFENSKISLRNWFTAIYLLTTNTWGISSYELARKLNIRQATAWFILHRIREIYKEKHEEKLTGVVQLDETAVGGKNKNRHKNKKVKNSQGRSLADKTWVFGIVKNNEAHARVYVVPNTDVETLLPLIDENVDQSSTIVTDGHRSYWGLSDYYEKHVMVKIDGAYSSDEGYNTNRVEGLWTHLKKMYNGTYHHMSKKHLQKYCDELAYKYNNKKPNDCVTFDSAVGRIDSSSRLKYKQLVGDGKKRKVQVSQADKDQEEYNHDKLRLEAEFRGKISSGRKL